MNTVYYFMKSAIVLILLCLPSGVSGQVLKKESVPVTVDGAQQNREYAIVYAEGLAKGASWPMGTVLTNNGATIRHQVSRGNGGNISVNDRVSFRFIVAPTDVSRGANLWWNGGSGFQGSPNTDSLNETFTGSPDRGCANYHTDASGKGRKWRLPTQRELQLIWLLQDAINIVYAASTTPFSREPMQQMPYWSSTEKDATNAWAVDFSPTNFRTYWTLKRSDAKVRCVSDY